MNCGVTLLRLGCLARYPTYSQVCTWIHSACHLCATLFVTVIAYTQPDREYCITGFISTRRRRALPFDGALPPRQARPHSRREACPAACHAREPALKPGFV